MQIASERKARASDAKVSIFIVYVKLVSGIFRRINQKTNVVRTSWIGSIRIGNTARRAAAKLHYLIVHLGRHRLRISRKTASIIQAVAEISSAGCWMVWCDYP